MRRKYYIQQKHSGLMTQYGNFYFYLYLEDFFYNMFISEFRYRTRIIINFHVFNKLKKICKLNFNILYKHLCKSSGNKNILLEPVFLYGGQFFAKYSLFFTLLKEHNINGAVLHKNNIPNKIGNNFFLFDYNKSIFDSNFFKNEDHKNLFLVKHDLSLYFEKNNFDFNEKVFFNIQKKQITEIYKILVLLKLN